MGYALFDLEGFVLKKRLFSILFSLFYIFSVCNIVYATYADEQWQWIDGVKQERCTYRAWHEAYDRLGISLPTNWGNAGTWADNARNAGYSVDNNPTANSIVCWSGGGYGHVAYVTGVDNTYIYIREGGINPSNSYPAYWYRDDKYLKSNQNRWSGFSLKGYIHLRDAVQKPGTTQNIYSDRVVYNSREEIKLSWDAVSEATEYYVYMWKDGVELYGTYVGNNTSFTSAPTSQGNYTFLVRAGNSAGYCDETKSYSFMVTDSVPDAVSNLRSQKTVYATNEYITFQWDKANGTQNYWVYLWKDGKELYGVDRGLNTEYVSAPLSAGEYTLCIRNGNINGFHEGNKSYSFTVKDSVQVHPEEGTYIIYSALDNHKCVDVYGTSNDDGANIQLYEYCEAGYNKFKITAFGDAHRITNIKSNKCVDVADASSDNGANIWQYKFNETAAQKWIFEDAGNGYVYVRSALGRYMDVENAGTSNGTNIQTWQFNGSNAQKFRLVLLEPQTETTVTKSDTLTVSTNLINITSGKIIVAGYKDNKVVDFAIKDYSVDKEIFVLNGNIDKVKVMVWDGLDSLKPLTETEVIPQSKWILN